MMELALWRGPACSGGGLAGKEGSWAEGRLGGRDKTAASRGCSGWEVVAPEQALRTPISARHLAVAAGALRANSCCNRHLSASYLPVGKGAGA